jgi:hypothetical protein
MKIKELISTVLLFLKDYDDIEILNNGSDENGIIVIEYSWYGYEEWESNELTLNLNNYVLKLVERGYSCEGGDYEQPSTMTFVDFNDLFTNFKKRIKEYYV